MAASTLDKGAVQGNTLDKGAVQSVVAVGGFVPYPNPRYALTGGMQSMNGGV